MPLAWHPSMSTGVDTVDNQHKQLILQLNELALALNSGQEAAQLQTMLDFLANYAITHFGHEEYCMEKHRCPAAQANRLAHQEFLRVFGAFRERLDKDGPSSALAFDVEQQLMSWLMAHICGVDVQLRPCVAQVK